MPVVTIAKSILFVSKLVTLTYLVLSTSIAPGASDGKESNTAIVVTTACVQVTILSNTSLIPVVVTEFVESLS